MIIKTFQSHLNSFLEIFYSFCNLKKKSKSSSHLPSSPKSSIQKYSYNLKGLAQWVRTPKEYKEGSSEFDPCCY